MFMMMIMMVIDNSAVVYVFGPTCIQGDPKK